jgi:hypothetical protein
MNLTLRASGLDQLFACNGSLLAQSFVSRPDTEEDSATEGSLLHYLIAKRLVLELGATAPDGLTPPHLPKGYKLPAFSAWIVDWGVQVVKDFVPSDWTLMVEVGLAYEYALPRPVWIPLAELSDVPVGAIRRTRADGTEEVLVTHFTLSGHLDVLAMSPDGKRSLGLDWKTGVVGADPAEQNWQASGYDTLVATAWPDIEDAEFKLCQPRIDSDATGIERISSSRLNGDELRRMTDVIRENVNRALENRYETNSGQKQCRYCALALTRPWDCPSMAAELSFMKANLTPETLAALRAMPRDGALGDFVISGRTLTAPIKAATELLHERLDTVGHVDADCGTRITRTTRPGDYEVPDKQAFYGVLKVVLPEEADRVECSTFGMGEIKKRIAVTRGIVQKTVKPMEPSAEKVFDAELRPLVNQQQSRILIFS